MRDMNTGISIVKGILPQTITTGGGAKNTGDIDLQGCNAATLSAAFGASGDTLSGSVKLDVKIEHADDNGSGAAGTYAACAAKDILGLVPDANGIVITVDATGEDSSVYQFGYVGNKRFVKATITPSSGNTSGTPFCLNITKGHLSIGK